jgi:hypothetical protein
MRRRRHRELRSIYIKLFVALVRAGCSLRMKCYQCHVKARLTTSAMKNGAIANKEKPEASNSHTLALNSSLSLFHRLKRIVVRMCSTQDCCRVERDVMQSLSKIREPCCHDLAPAVCFTCSHHTVTAAKGQQAGIASIWSPNDLT